VKYDQIAEAYINMFENTNDLVTNFWNSLSDKQKRVYSIRDNCGPACLDFINFAKKNHGVDLKRISGFFKADIPVTEKADFTNEMKKELLSTGMDFNSADDRRKFVENSKYHEQWKHIPHYWAIDNSGKIYDPSGHAQFKHMTADFDENRYKLTDE
jgi:hypothetical protein